MNQFIRFLAFGALISASGGQAQSLSSGSPGGAPPLEGAAVPPSELITGYSKVTSEPMASDQGGRPEYGLEVHFGDGHTERIPPEIGAFTDEDARPLRQSTFESIQLADDHRTLGWLATYMVCAQSYPCPAALVLYRSGQNTHRLTPTAGIVWRWMFLPPGKQVVLQSGFPHGDDLGSYALYDVDSGRLLESFVTGPEVPEWVQALARSNP